MYKLLKRFLDLVGSISFVFLLIPIWVMTPVLIATTMGLPVFYKQLRIGYKNKAFQIFKFRTMRGKTLEAISDSQRITALGRILRVTRIDELPQLFNIVMGRMSFIGPRPLLPDYLPFYNMGELRRHDVRPGLSGLSQVSGSYLDWEQQFKLDVEYVEKMSLVLDISILFKTIGKVFRPSRKLRTGDAGRQRFDRYRSDGKG